MMWDRFKKYYTEFPTLGLSLDLSRMKFNDDFFDNIHWKMQKAFQDMDTLEKGAIANIDEERMVGHYWLRTPSLAPCTKIREEIEQTLIDIKKFAAKIHSGEIQGSQGKFEYLLVIGIGGSALGPQFVGSALGRPSNDMLKLYFFDNTDPDGIDKVLESLDQKLGKTLCVVISKSGGTKETANGMKEAKHAYEIKGLNFESHAVAVTMTGSKLYNTAKSNKWINIFPMWDWVGGRTSELSAVGLLPAALQGLNIDEMLKGASFCDEQTRKSSIKENPAAQLALMWYYAGNGKGEKDMVIIPYKDRLELFSRYLQQLIMESIGKEQLINGEMAYQGIAVYGNKGSTDQHAYIQQLREGIPNFFVTFIEVKKDRIGNSINVYDDEMAGGEKITSGDYLHGFYLGTREALFEKDRESITITINELSAFSIGVLIALYERAVGFYASLVHINAYHQPGVEAGKKAAEGILKLKLAILELLGRANNRGKSFSIEDIIKNVDDKVSRLDICQKDVVFKLCEHLAANTSQTFVKRISGMTPASSKYQRY